MKCKTLAMIAAATLLAGSLAVPLAAEAQAVRDVKIGFVNVAKLLEEAPQARAASKALEDEFAPRRRDILARQQALKTRADKFQKDAAVMSPEERRNAENELRKDERELNRLAGELQDDFNIRRNEALGKVQQDLGNEIRGYAGRNNYDLVVADGVYVNPSIDITAQVLQALQARAGQGGAAPAARP